MTAGYGHHQRKALKQLQGYEWSPTMDDTKYRVDEDKTKGLTTDPSPLTPRRSPLLRASLVLLACLGVGAVVLSTPSGGMPCARAFIGVIGFCRRAAYAGSGSN